MARERRFLTASILSFLFTLTFGFGLFANSACAGSWYGIQGSISGDTLLVGQRLGDGVPGSSSDVGGVEVQDRQIAGNWTITTTLESLLAPEALSIGAEFGGGAVLLDGDMAVVGAYRNTVGELLEAGNVFVFERVGSAWMPTAELQMPGGAVQNAQFGASGDTDSQRTILSSTGLGKAFIYSGFGEMWDSGVELLGGDIYEPVGVSIYGNVAAVGNYGISPHVDVWRYNNQGGAWDFETAIANPGAANNFLGSSIDIYGDTMVVSARAEAVGGVAGAGAVYVYRYAGDAWTLDQKIENPQPAANDRFGYDVSIEGDRLVIGAPCDDADGTNSGTVYLYDRLGLTWTLSATIPAYAPRNGLWSGEFVDLSGNDLLFGGSGRTADDPGDGDISIVVLGAAPQGPQHPGDANRDGMVDAEDAAILAANWLAGGGATWADGDFNNDGKVNEADATIMATNWMWIYTPPPVAVPEPTSLASLLLLLWLACFCLRKRCQEPF